MDRAEFAKDVSVADGQFRPLAPVLEVLRIEADRREGKKPVGLSQNSRTLDLGVRAEGRPAPEVHLRSDDRVGPDRDVRVEPCFGRDDRSGVDSGRHGRSTRTDISSASAHSTPSTSARARHLHVRIRSETISASSRS